MDPVPPGGDESPSSHAKPSSSMVGESAAPKKDSDSSSSFSPFQPVSSLFGLFRKVSQTNNSNNNNNDDVEDGTSSSSSSSKSQAAAAVSSAGRSQSRENASLSSITGIFSGSRIVNPTALGTAPGSAAGSSALAIREEDPIERGRRTHALWEDVYTLGGVESLAAFPTSMAQMMIRGSLFYCAWKGNLLPNPVRVRLSEDYQRIVVGQKTIELEDVRALKVHTEDPSDFFLSEHDPRAKTAMPMAITVLLYTSNPIHLVSTSDLDYLLWTQGLTKLLVLLTSVDPLQEHLKRIWLAVMEHEDALASAKDLRVLFHRLNLDIGERFLRERVADIKKEKADKLTFAEFHSLFRLMRTPPDLVDLFKKYAHSTKYLLAEELCDLLRSEQCEELITLDFCQKVISKYVDRNEKLKFATERRKLGQPVDPNANQYGKSLGIGSVIMPRRAQVPLSLRASHVGALTIDRTPLPTEKPTDKAPDPPSLSPRPGAASTSNANSNTSISNSSPISPKPFVRQTSREVTPSSTPTSSSSSGSVIMNATSSSAVQNSNNSSGSVIVNRDFVPAIPSSSASAAQESAANVSPNPSSMSPSFATLRRGQSAAQFQIGQIRGKPSAAAVSPRSGVGVPSSSEIISATPPPGLPPLPQPIDTSVSLLPPPPQLLPLPPLPLPPLASPTPPASQQDSIALSPPSTDMGLEGSSPVLPPLPQPPPSGTSPLPSPSSTNQSSGGGWTNVRKLLSNSTSPVPSRNNNPLVGSSSGSATVSSGIGSTLRGNSSANNSPATSAWVAAVGGVTGGARSKSPNPSPRLAESSTSDLTTATSSSASSSASSLTNLPPLPAPPPSSGTLRTSLTNLPPLPAPPSPIASPRDIPTTITTENNPKPSPSTSASTLSSSSGWSAARLPRANKDTSDSQNSTPGTTPHNSERSTLLDRVDSSDQISRGNLSTEDDDSNVPSRRSMKFDKSWKLLTENSTTDLSSSSGFVSKSGGGGGGGTGSGDSSAAGSSPRTGSFEIPSPLANAIPTTSGGSLITSESSPSPSPRERAYRVKQNDLKSETMAKLEEERKQKLAESIQRGVLTFTDFAHLMTSSLNRFVDPEQLELNMPMSQPLSNYWIASSHNTYITGDQFSSASSTEMYVNVLKSGCRCVEVDIWDGPDGEPIVYHGRTLTSKISFVSVIEAIRDWAFYSSPYPVILSFENHASPPQQLRMVEILRSTLGDMLAVPQSANDYSLPSPQEMMGKILIKGKTITTDDEADQILEEEENAMIGSMYGQELEKKFGRSTERAKKEAEKKGREAERAKEREKQKFTKELSDITFLRAYRWETFDIKYEEPKALCASFSEVNIEKKITRNLSDLIEMNRFVLSRTYPKATRVDSSNYNPITCWNAGVQLVALNYQTPSTYMYLNYGKFLLNGNCGYVLKPQNMRSPHFTYGDGKIKVLEVKILSASMLPKTKEAKVICPTVSVAIFGLEEDCREVRTQLAKNNGFNPVWSETFEFPLTASHMAQLLIWVDDQSLTTSDHVGHFSIPVESLRQGLRSVPLFDRSQREIPQAHLLVRIAFKETTTAKATKKQSEKMLSMLY